MAGSTDRNSSVAGRDSSSGRGSGSERALEGGREKSTTTTLLGYTCHIPKMPHSSRRKSKYNTFKQHVEAEGGPCCVQLRTSCVSTTRARRQVEPSSHAPLHGLPNYCTIATNIGLKWQQWSRINLDWYVVGGEQETFPSHSH